MKNLKVSLAGALALSLPVCAHAQSPGDEPIAEVVITASRSVQKIHDVLPSVSVLTREEIERQQAPTLVDLIQLLPGVEIGRNGGPGTTASIFMRGQSSNNVAVFIDGVRVQTDHYGNLKLIDVSPQHIEKVEVLRGNMAAVYGEAATGGVINVFTRRGSAQTGPAGSLTLGTGGTTDATAGYTLKGEQYRLGINFDSFKTNNMSAMDPKQSTSVNPDKDPFERNSVFLNGEFFASNDISMGFLANSIHSRVQYDSAFDANTDVHLGQSNSHDLTLFVKAKIIQAWSTKLSLSNSKHDSTDRTNGVETNKTLGEQATVQWSNEYRVGPGNATFGLDLNNATFMSRSTWVPAGDTYDRDSSAHYLGYATQWGALSAQINLRHDEVTATSPLQTVTSEADSWLLGLGYAIDPQLKLTGLWSTSFRAPNAGELFGSFGGNPNLMPERHRGNELGLTYRISNGQLRWVRFETETKNAIDWDSSASQSRNIGLAHNKGYEMSWHGQISRTDVVFSAVMQDPINAQTGARLARRAQEYASLNLNRKMLGIDWGVRVMASADRVDGSNTLGGYSVVNLSASKPLTPYWLGRIKVENAFDKKYQLAHGYNTPGRGVFASVQYAAK